MAHSQTGNIPVGRISNRGIPFQPLEEKIIDAAVVCAFHIPSPSTFIPLHSHVQEAGFGPRNDDYNGQSQWGFGRVIQNITKNGMRCLASLPRT
jgi:hypothetical protein